MNYGRVATTVGKGEIRGERSGKAINFSNAMKTANLATSVISLESEGLFCQVVVADKVVVELSERLKVHTVADLDPINVILV